MGTTTLVSVEEYLRTSFPDADREYIDGRIVERNVGTGSHEAKDGVLRAETAGIEAPLSEILG